MDDLLQDWLPIDDGTREGTVPLRIDMDHWRRRMGGET